MHFHLKEFIIMNRAIISNILELHLNSYYNQSLIFLLIIL